MRLQDAVVVITGGGTGIGKASALLFARQGARVALWGRRRAPLEETAELIEKNGGRACAVSTDVRHWQQLQHATHTVLDRFRTIDILVNNAGVAFSKPCLATTEEQWDQLLDTNLKGAFLCCKAVLPTMLKTGQGTIINVSSILGQTGITDMTAYCASKFGMLGLTQSLAAELKSQGITVLAVCPGSTDTQLHRKLVGESLAKAAISPQVVAHTIVDLSTRAIPLPSGEATRVKVHAVRRAGNAPTWRLPAKRWLKNFAATVQSISKPVRIR